MTDSLKVSKTEIHEQHHDPKTDRLTLSGVVTVVLEYGETLLSLPIKFHSVASTTEAEATALKYAGNLFHFGEYQAGIL